MQKFVDEHLDEMINDLRELVSFNSENANDQEPFGKENRKVLDKALSLMEKKGLKTTNLDYYCGYGEVGEGDKTIGILAHLDIVPAGDGWDTNPFELVCKGNTLYGRGVSDDKGAAVASMWAIKYLIDSGYKFNKKLRLILGCNEETGSKCIKYYVEKCGDVDMGFTPDGNFPGIYAEKGMISGYLEGRKSKILNIVSGGATNIVSKKCEVVIPENSINIIKLDEFFKENKIDYEFKDNCLTVFGKAAHASTPDLGVNAISYAMAGLYNADFNDSFVNFFMKHIGLTKHGELMGYDNLKDDISNTSINCGIAEYKNNTVYVSFDMRFPVKSNTDKCKKPLYDAKDENNSFVINEPGIEPLYFDIDSPFIKALDKAYRKVTGDNETKMEAIGGGTYAKSIENIIAFGCEFQGEDNHIHDVNECLSIDAFKKQVLIYIEAIKNLNEVV